MLQNKGVFAVLLAALICFFRIFYSRSRRPSEEIPLPEGEVYEPYYDTMRDWVRRARTAEQTHVSVRSFDGLTLRGRYFEYAKGAPIEILFHGYRGSAERDMSGGVYRCFALGHNALIVDQRSCGTSDGHVITFGIRERRDCRTWLDFVLREIDPDAKVILTGVSMGAATVMLAAGEELPSNVVGVLADCGFTSARDIIRRVIREMHLPVTLLYPIARLGARLFGGFDLEEDAPVEAVKRAKVPILFIHGDTDDFVPYEMSVENQAACASPSELVPIPGAGHGLCYPSAPEQYLATLKRFFAPY